MAATSKTVTGGLTPSGDVPTLTASRYLANQALQELGFAGALSRIRNRFQYGVLSFTKALNLNRGTILFWNYLNLSGTLTASLNKEGGAYRLGRMASEGVLTTIRVVRYLANQALQELSFSGTVTTGTPGEEGVNRKGLLWPVGYLRYLKNTILNSGGMDLSGISTPYQAGKEAWAKAVSGVFDFAGDLIEILIQKQHELAKGVELTFSGLITNKLISKLRSGGVAFDKYCTWRWEPYTGIERQRYTFGGLSFTSTLEYLQDLFQKGSLSFSSYLYKNVSKLFDGPLDFTGTVIGFFTPAGTLPGVLSFAGDVSMKRSMIMMSGGMTPSGLLKPKSITRKVTGSLSPAKEVEKSKELLYYGIINP